MAKKKKKAQPDIWRWWIFGISLFAVSGLAAFASSYGDRILPGVRAGSINLAGLTPSVAVEKIRRWESTQRLTLRAAGRTWHPTYKELGIHLDASRTVTDAYAIGRNAPLSAWARTFVAGQPVDASYVWSDDRLKSYLDMVVSRIGQGPLEPSAAFRDGQFEITPGRSGLVVDADQLQRQAHAAIIAGRPVTVTLQTSLQLPTAAVADFGPAVEAATTMVRTPLTIEVDGSTRVLPSDVLAGWLSFRLTGDPSRPVTVDVSHAAIGSYLLGIAKEVNVAPVPEERVVSLQKSETVRPGQPGRSLDISAGVDVLASALANGSSGPVSLAMTAVSPDITLASAPQAPIATGKVILVDISKQHEYVFQDGVLVFSSPVSTGLNDWTPTGTFKIYAKTKKQKMSGPDYYVPNVPDILWFKGDYSIHGVYWHNDFGIRPRSHGCVGMPLEEAAWLFDWAEVGTPVIIYKSSQTAAGGVS